MKRTQLQGFPALPKEVFSMLFPMEEESSTPKEQYSHMPTVEEIFGPMSDSAKESAENSPPAKVRKHNI